LSVKLLLFNNSLTQRDVNYKKKNFNPLKAELTLNPLTWKIWWAPNNASRWQMGFNSAFKGL